MSKVESCAAFCQFYQLRAVNSSPERRSLWREKRYIAWNHSKENIFITSMYQRRSFLKKGKVKMLIIRVVGILLSMTVWSMLIFIIDYQLPHFISQGARGIESVTLRNKFIRIMFDCCKRYGSCCSQPNS